MSAPTFSEFVRGAESARAANVRDRINDLRGFERTAVSAAAVTGSPEWDTFAEIIGALIERADARKTQAERAALAPGLVNADETMRHKIEAIRAGERAATLRAMLALPRDLKDNGQKAREIIDRMEPRNGEADAA